MDLLTFGAGIGLPAPFKVIYDAAKQALISEPAEGGVLNGEPCRKAVSADLKLTAYFAAKDGALCGVQYACGNIGELPEAEIETPFAPDGFVRILKCASSYSGEVNYVVFPKTTAVYDRANKIVAVGNLNYGESFYRLGENLCVGIGDRGTILCFLIKI